MKFLKTILAVVLCATSLCVSAQDKYEFNPHWYFQGNVGGQYTLGEADFSDLISPNVQLGVGYNFSPVLGVRLTANGWQSKGGWVTPSQTYDWKYVAPQLDLTVNLSNALCGFNPKRVFNASVFVGAAANIAFSNDDANSLNTNGYKLEYLWDGTKIRPAGRAGLDLDFRLSDAVSLNVEGSANMISDKYNSKKAGNADWYFNALVGLKVALGKTYNKVEEPVEIPVTPKPTPTPAKKVEKKPEVVKAPAEKKIDVFFLIRSSEISEQENAKVQEMVAFLKQNPSAKVVVTGYADAGTGNPKINMGYSEKRAKVVTDALVKAGIDASRITTEAKGDTVQPFAENDLNRVSIAIAK